MGKALSIFTSHSFHLSNLKLSSQSQLSIVEMLVYLKINLIGVDQAGVLDGPHWEKEKVNSKDGDEDKDSLRRLHHHVRVVPVEVVLKMQFWPWTSVSRSWPNGEKWPDDLDNVAEKEDVDEDNDDGGDGEEVDAVTLVHPAELVFICHSEHRDRKMIKYRQKTCFDAVLV